VELAKRIQAVEEVIAAQNSKLHGAKELVAQKARIRKGLQRDLAVWRSHHEQSLKLTNEAERELSAFRQDRLCGELLRRTEQHDELQAQKAALKIRDDQLIAEVQAAEQTRMQQEAADAKAMRLVEDLQQQANSDLQQLKLQLADAETGQRRCKEEAAKVQQQTSEKRLLLEQALAKLTSDLDKEKSEFERKIRNERQKCESFKESLEKLREEHRTSYKAVFEGPGQQISSLETEINDIQRNTYAERSSHQQKSDEYRSRIEELETELARMHAKLEQTEHEVQDTTTRVNLSRVTNQASLESLQRDRNSKQDELQRIRSSIAHKKEQLFNIMNGAEEERKRTLRELDDARDVKAKKLIEVDRRIQALRSDHSFAVEDTAVPDGTFGTSAPSRDRSRDRSDLFRETDRLRSLCDSRYGSALPSAYAATGYLQDISNRLETSPHRRATESALASMEKRAADLRRGLKM